MANFKSNSSLTTPRSPLRGPSREGPWAGRWDDWLGGWPRMAEDCSNDTLIEGSCLWPTKRNTTTRTLTAPDADEPFMCQQIVVYAGVMTFHTLSESFVYAARLLRPLTQRCEDLRSNNGKLVSSKRDGLEKTCLSWVSGIVHHCSRGLCEHVPEKKNATEHPYSTCERMPTHQGSFFRLCPDPLSVRGWVPYHPYGGPMHKKQAKLANASESTTHLRLTRI
jgi:hypothetical protein